MSRKQVYRLSESLMIQMLLPCGSAKTICICQLKSLEITLAGSLRREHVADASIKKLEAEIEHLNRLVIPFHLHCSIPTYVVESLNHLFILGSAKRGRY